MLRFTLGDIPIGVHFSFLLIALISPTSDVEEVVAWTIVAFLAILLHELGHAIVARHYGALPVRVTLFALGGVTTYPAKEDLTPGRRFLIAAAGSTVGIVTGGLLWLVWSTGVFDEADVIVRVAVLGYIWASLGWGILNWIPVRPLDGGAMLTSFLEIVVPSRALAIARGVSLVAGLCAAFLLYRFAGSTFGAVFILLITLIGMRDDTPSPASRQREPDPDTDEQPGTQERATPTRQDDPHQDDPPQPPPFPI